MAFPPVTAPSIISQWLSADRIDDLAERVAGRSRMAVWQRVAHRLPSLGPIEGRGYLRSRAIGVVQEETDRLIEQEGPAIARLRGRIVESALESLIQAITSQMQQRPVAGMLRKAA